MLSSLGKACKCIGFLPNFRWGCDFLQVALLVLLLLTSARSPCSGFCFGWVQSMCGGLILTSLGVDASNSWMARGAWLQVYRSLKHLWSSCCSMYYVMIVEISGTCCSQTFHISGLSQCAGSLWQPSTNWPGLISPQVFSAADLELLCPWGHTWPWFQEVSQTVLLRQSLSACLENLYSNRPFPALITPTIKGTSKIWEEILKQKKK